MTEQPKYTSEGLPVITRETFDALRSDYTDITADKEDLRRSMQRENPLIWAYVERTDVAIEDRGFPEDVGTSASFYMLTIYGLLRRQAEANKLEDKIGEGLPVITIESYNALARDLKEKTIGFEDQLVRIVGENLWVMEYFERAKYDMEHRAFPENARNGVLISMLRVYELLRRQAEANKWERKFKI